jgi:hypothetical protein
MVVSVQIFWIVTQRGIVGGKQRFKGAAPLYIKRE